MANTDLSIRFTDEQYATRLDVMRALNTSLIDSIWRNIEDYRGRFARLLSLRDIAKRPLRITFTPNIVDKITILERKFIRAMSQYSQLDVNSVEHDTVRNTSYKKILGYVAMANKIEVSEEETMSILNDDNTNPQYKSLVTYYNTLRHFEEFHHDPIDENFLADILVRVKGEGELVSFYREKDFSHLNQVVIGKEYDFAPVATIEFLMNNFLDFIKNSEISFVVKIVAAYYFIDYVKPFETNNEEIALFIVKSILSHNDIAEASALIPLETLFVMRNDNFKKVFLEVQKTNDLTYALLTIIDIALVEVQDFLDLVTKVKMKEVKREYRSLEGEIITPKMTSQTKESEKPIPPISEEPVLKKPDVMVENGKTEVRVVLPKIAPILKEEDSRLVVKNLLESNPFLRQKQAEFYAQHCSIGKYYTIAQYKKEMDVVYETARTSMDNLVQLGYYRREMIKNKFVYTPIANAEKD